MYHTIIFASHIYVVCVYSYEVYAHSYLTLKYT